MAKSKKATKKLVKEVQLPKRHKYSVKGGRPAHYETPEDLEEEVDEFFSYIEGEFHMEKRTRKKKKGKGDEEEEGVEEYEVQVWDRYPEPATVTGLVLYLGFAHRQSLDDYEKRDGFSDIIKRARSRIEHAYELRLYNDRPTGAIFALSNMGWKNQHQIDHTTKGEAISEKRPATMLPDGTYLEI